MRVKNPVRVEGHVPHGKKTVEVVTRFFTDLTDDEGGQFRLKRTCVPIGACYVVANKYLGIPSSGAVPFDTLAQHQAAMERAMLKSKINVLPISPIFNQ